MEEVVEVIVLLSNNSLRKEEYRLHPRPQLSEDKGIREEALL